MKLGYSWRSSSVTAQSTEPLKRLVPGAVSERDIHNNPFFKLARRGVIGLSLILIKLTSCDAHI